MSFFTFSRKIIIKKVLKTEKKNKYNPNVYANVENK